MGLLSVISYSSSCGFSDSLKNGFKTATEPCRESLAILSGLFKKAVFNLLNYGDFRVLSLEGREEQTFSRRVRRQS